MASFVDLVISGPDMSGTSTQLKDLMAHCHAKGLRVMDLRGNEIDVLYHALAPMTLRGAFPTLRALSEQVEAGLPGSEPAEAKGILAEYHEFLDQAYRSVYQACLGSCTKNEVSRFIDPESADVFILEEPPYWGAGMSIRSFELHRSQYGESINPLAAALNFQSYRADIYARFRKPLREAGKIIIRSRSEESACYQVFDPHILPQGLSVEKYLELPGHSYAFGYPPTHLFIVCGPAEWAVEEYLALKEKRSAGRTLDDHEINVPYQIMVNERYATDWIDRLYEKGCAMHGSLTTPAIARFPIAPADDAEESKAIIKKLMGESFDMILTLSGW